MNASASAVAPAHVAVVEDEPKIAALLRDYLVAAGFRVSVLDSGVGAIAWVRERAPDAVLLDVMLPGLDGLAICRGVRAFSNVPILMITARVEEIDRLLGLELGADDYICKPFSPREVVARVRAVLRRVRAGSGAAASGVELDEAQFEARLHGRTLALTPVEFRLLAKLSSQPGRVFSRAQLIDALYRDHRVVSERTVDSHVKNLRRKLAELGVDPIASVYGVGYRFERADDEANATAPPD
ncbi:MAG TPA: response regulator [Dokdonella sp.]